MSDVKNSSLATDLVSYWELEEASGTRFDAHGANDLTDNNTVGSVAAIIGNGSSHVRASNEYLSNTSLLSSVANTWTFSGWFYTGNVPAADQCIFTTRQSSGNNNIIQVEWSTASSGQMRIICFTSGAGFAKDWRVTSVAHSTWYHLCLTHDGTTMELYLNGVVPTITKSTNLSLTQTATSRTFRLGAETVNGNVLDGRLDEWGVWTRALTSTEASDLYNGGAGLSYDGGGAAQTARRGVVMMM